MPSLQFRANWTKNTKKERLIEYSQALLAGPLYTFIPTLCKTDGPLGMVIGGLSCILPGILLDMPGLVSGAVGAISTHASYLWLNQPCKDMFGRYFWRMDPKATTVPPSLGDPVAARPTSSGGRDMVQLKNGEVVYGYRSTDLPSDAYQAPQLPAAGGSSASGGGMNDYYKRGGMNDYYKRPSALEGVPAGSQISHFDKSAAAEGAEMNLF